jgi:hypothetical protein
MMMSHATMDGKTPTLQRKGTITVEMAHGSRDQRLRGPKPQKPPAAHFLAARPKPTVNAMNQVWGHTVQVVALCRGWEFQAGLCSGGGRENKSKRKG